MYKTFALPFFFLLILVSSCKKESPKLCWQKVDNFGNKLELVCNKTEAEMQVLYPGGCGYYKTGGEKFCWTVNGNFLKEVTQAEAEYYARCFGGNATPAKVDCNFCGRWYHREKRTYKVTNTATYSPVRIETFCGDTAKTIFHGRQVIKKDSPDSLIVLQFSSDGTTW